MSDGGKVELPATPGQMPAPKRSESPGRNRRKLPLRRLPPEHLGSELFELLARLRLDDSDTDHRR